MDVCMQVYVFAHRHSLVLALSWQRSDMRMHKRRKV